MKTARDVKRQERARHAVPSVAIAGYTNAGKSSLLNRLTGAGVLVEDALFATLDPTVRKADHADRPRLHAHRHRRLRAAAAAPARRGVPLDAGGGRGRRPDPARRRRLAPRPRGPALRSPRRSSPTSTRRTCPRSWWSTSATRPTRTCSARLQRREKHLVHGVRPAPARACRALLQLLEDEVPHPDVRVHVVAAVHRGRAGVTGARRGRGAVARSTSARAPRSTPASARRWRPSWRRTPSSPDAPGPAGAPVPGALAGRRRCWAGRVRPVDNGVRAGPFGLGCASWTSGRP